MKKTGLVLFLSWMYLHGMAQYALVEQLAQQVNQDSLITYVKQLTGLLPIATPDGDRVITNRLSGTSGNELAALFIKQKLTGWGVSYQEVNFSTTGQNIIAEITGRRTDKIMLAGAHYDAVGSRSTEFFYPGADDNASGTAAVLEIARVAAHSEFPVTLQLAFWDEEEQNLTGSRASAPGYMQSRLIGYINLDMIAYDGNNDSSFDIHVRPAGYSVEMGTRAYDLINLYNVPLKPRLINPGDPNTDHGSFWENNLTAIGINEEYEGDFTPHWHKLTDSLVYFNQSYFYRMSRFAATAYLHFTLDSTNQVGLQEHGISSLLSVYPNPFNEEIRFNLPGEYVVNYGFLCDATGKQVWQGAVTGNSVQVPADLSAGLYWLVLQDARSNLFRKKVVKR